MEIRPYRPADLATLKKITVDAFGGVSIDQGMEIEFGSISGRDWKWRKARHVDEDLRMDPAGIFVLDDEGRAVGYISTVCDREAGIGRIPNLAIVAELRGQGWGRRLILHALEHFRRQGMTHGKIETLAQNKVGYALYTSLGFREVARQVHFIADLSQPPTPAKSARRKAAPSPRKRVKSSHAARPKSPPRRSRSEKK
jgi:ribosomal protein S18 acetylase RimI-like enzyme